MVAATACGGDGKDAKDSAAGGVRDALDRVADTPDTRTWFTYADLAGLRAANGDAGRLGPYAQIAGLAEDWKFADRLPPVYGFDPRDADRTWTAGAAPKQATVLSGGSSSPWWRSGSPPRRPRGSTPPRPARSGAPRPTTR
ncbi:hypothetical protein ACU686_19880 [Yinghuangia aomiensis]